MSKRGGAIKLHRCAVFEGAILGEEEHTEKESTKKRGIAPRGRL